MRAILSIAVLLSALVCRGAVYYVDTAGDDGFPGTIGQPFLTVQKGVNTAQPGDTIKVNTGTYQEAVISARSGTSNAPIILDGQGVATVWSFYLGDSYIRLNNLTISGRTNQFASLLYMDRGAHHCIISNNVVDGSYNTNINMVTWNAPESAPFGTNAASDTLVISNTFQHAIGCTVLSIYGDRNVVRGNRILDCSEVDWFRLWGRSNYIQGNICSNNFEAVPSTGNHPDIIQTFGDNGYGSKDNVIEGNLFTAGWVAQVNMLTADGLTNDIRDWTFRNNLYADIGIGGPVVIPGTTYYNNLFLRCNKTNGGHPLIFTFLTHDGVDYFANDCRVLNNVFIDCGDSRTTVGWYSFDKTLTNTSTADYNYVGKNSYGSVTVNPLHQIIGSAGGWDNDSWWEPHGINGGNPAFENQSGRDYRLMDNSPLIGSATNLYSLFTLDFAGSVRPSVGAWDIGAYQYSTNNGTSPPRYLSIIGTTRTGKASL